MINDAKRSEEEQKWAFEMHDRVREELLKRELSNSENYDKYLLTLSAASLGFSLTALRFVIPAASAEHIWMIKLGWMLLLGCIITSIAAFWISNKAIAIELKIAEDYYLNNKQDARNQKNNYKNINSYLNLYAGSMFALAILLIVLFAMLNID